MTENMGVLPCERAWRKVEREGKKQSGPMSKLELMSPSTVPWTLRDQKRSMSRQGLLLECPTTFWGSRKFIVSIQSETMKENHALDGAILARRDAVPLVNPHHALDGPFMSSSPLSTSQEFWVGVWSPQIEESYFLFLPTGQEMRGCRGESHAPNDVIVWERVQSLPCKRIPYFASINYQ